MVKAKNIMASDKILHYKAFNIAKNTKSGQ